MKLLQLVLECHRRMYNTSNNAVSFSGVSTLHPGLTDSYCSQQEQCILIVPFLTAKNVSYITVFDSAQLSRKIIMNNQSVTSEFPYCSEASNAGCAENDSFHFSPAFPQYGYLNINFYYCSPAVKNSWLLTCRLLTGKVNF